MFAVFLEALPVGEKHRHARAVLALIENLLGRVIVRFEIDLRAEERAALAGLQVVAINRRRLGEADVRVKRLRVLAFAGEAARRSESRQRNLACALPRKLKYPNDRMRVLEIIRDETIADQR